MLQTPRMAQFPRQSKHTFPLRPCVIACKSQQEIEFQIGPLKSDYCNRICSPWSEWLSYTKIRKILPGILLGLPESN